MKQLIQRISSWIYARHWRTWVAHGAVTGLAGVGGLLLGLGPSGAVLASGYYVGAEREQLRFEPEASPWYDRLFDALAPLLVASGFVVPGLFG